MDYVMLGTRGDSCKWIINYYDTIKIPTPNYMNKYN